MPTNSSRFFCNRDCAYFPCHPGIEAENFNCLFCYCPLYCSPGCPGQYQRLDSGCKDCSACVFPHQAENYDLILKHLSSLIQHNANLSR